MADSQLYDEIFTLSALNAAKYDRVARISGLSLDRSTSFSLDINTELYPCQPGESVSLVLASTLSLTGSDSADGEGGPERGWRDLSRSGEATLADAYDYVMRGKVYKFDRAEPAVGEGQVGGEGMVGVYVSFGGLLLYLNGPAGKLGGVKMDYVYLLLKK